VDHAAPDRFADPVVREEITGSKTGADTDPHDDVCVEMGGEVIQPCVS